MTDAELRQAMKDSREYDAYLQQQIDAAQVAASSSDTLENTRRTPQEIEAFIQQYCARRDKRLADERAAQLQLPKQPVHGRELSYEEAFELIKKAM